MQLLLPETPSSCREWAPRVVVSEDRRSPFKSKSPLKLTVVADSWYPSTREAEAGGPL